MSPEYQCARCGLHRGEHVAVDVADAPFGGEVYVCPSALFLSAAPPPPVKPLFAVKPKRKSKVRR